MAKTYKQIMDEARQLVPEVSPEQLKARLDKGEHPVVLDVREKEEVRQGYVPGALSLPRGFLHPSSPTAGAGRARCSPAAS